MQVVTYNEGQDNSSGVGRLKALLDTVSNDADTLLISRGDGADAVMMSLDYYNSLMETVYLLKSPANAEHLVKSIAQYRRGQASPRELLDE